MKAEVKAPQGPKDLKNLNLESDEVQYLKLTEMFIGPQAQNIVMRGRKEKFVENFLVQASAGYVQCARHMLMALPIDNGLLKAVGGENFLGIDRQSNMSCAVCFIS